MSATRIPCPHCGGEARLVTGDVLYPHRRDLAHKWFYLCQPCDAHVGCHPGTTMPLGDPATRETRSARGRAHSAFDRLWKSKEMKRSEAYRWLASEVGFPKHRCHIGMMTAEECDRVVAAVKARKETANV